MNDQDLFDVGNSSDWGLVKANNTPSKSHSKSAVELIDAQTRKWLVCDISISMNDKMPYNDGHYEYNNEDTRRISLLRHHTAKFVRSRWENCAANEADFRVELVTFGEYAGHNTYHSIDGLLKAIGGIKATHGTTIFTDPLELVLRDSKRHTDDLVQHCILVTDGQGYMSHNLTAQFVEANIVLDIIVISENENVQMEGHWSSLQSEIVDLVAATGGTITYVRSVEALEANYLEKTTRLALPPATTMIGGK